MKKILFLLMAFLLLVACTDDEHDSITSSNVSEEIADSLSISPYSIDITQSKMTVVYKVTGASSIEVFYKDQQTTTWQDVDVDYNDNTVSVCFTKLTQRTYYNVLVIAHNGFGKSVTDMQTILFDYESAGRTYFMQPYLAWGSSVSDMKSVLSNSGYIYEAERSIEGGSCLECRFRYKELKSAYIFDEEQKFKEVKIYFDTNRVSVDELRRFVSYALGYLSYGNLHVVADEKDGVIPLYKTTEGSSYVFIYEKDGQSIVDYVSSAGFDLNNKVQL